MERRIALIGTVEAAGEALPARQRMAGGGLALRRRDVRTCLFRRRDIDASTFQKQADAARASGR
jgi:hypothetical protein